MRKSDTNRFSIKSLDIDELIYDKERESFNTKIDWMGSSISLDIYDLKEEKIGLAFTTLQQLLKNKKEWTEVMQLFAYKELINTKNTYWLEENEVELSKADFFDKMKFEAIVLYGEDEFSFYYNDGDMFWGHTIYVSATIKNGPYEASI